MERKEWEGDEERDGKGGGWRTGEDTCRCINRRDGLGKLQRFPAQLTFLTSMSQIGPLPLASFSPFSEVKGREQATKSIPLPSVFFHKLEWDLLAGRARFLWLALCKSWEVTSNMPLSFRGYPSPASLFSVREFRRCPRRSPGFSERNEAHEAPPPTSDTPPTAKMTLDLSLMQRRHWCGPV